jgi:hypothetical protein
MPLNYNLNVNGFNSPIKRYRLNDWIRKQDPTAFLSARNTSHRERHTQTKVKGWKMIYQASRSQKQAGIDILISEKVDFKAKLLQRDKVDHYILIKGMIHEEDIEILNTHAPNTSVPKFIKQILLDVKGRHIQMQ